MKSERTPTIRLGTFVAAGTCVLLAGMMLIGRKQHLFSHTFTVYAIFHDVGGLQIGSNVRYAGVNVGTVKSMDFIDQRTIRVTLLVEEKVRGYLTTSAAGTVSSEGLVGNKILVLAEPAAGGRPLVDQDSIQGYPPPSFDELMVQVKHSVDDVQRITQDTSVIAHRIRTGEGVVGKMFTDPVLARNLDQTLVNLRDGSKGFKENMDAVRHSWVMWGAGKDKAKE